MTRTEGFTWPASSNTYGTDRAHLHGGQPVQEVVWAHMRTYARFMKWGKGKGRGDVWDVTNVEWMTQCMHDQRHESSILAARLGWYVYVTGGYG